MSQQDQDDLNKLIASAVIAAIKPAMRLAWAVLGSVLFGTIAVVGYIERVDYNIRDATKTAKEAQEGVIVVRSIVNEHEKKLAVIEDRTAKKP